MLGGANGFNEMDRGLPGISRSVLPDRMRAPERAEVIERRTGAKGRTLITASRPPAVTSSRSCRRSASGARPGRSPSRAPRTRSRPVDRLDGPPRRSPAAPPNRTVTSFDFRDPSSATGWSLSPRGLGPPPASRFDVDLEVTVDTATLYHVYLGRASSAPRSSRQADDERPRTLQRGLGHWFTWSAFAASRLAEEAPHNGLAPRQPSIVYDSPQALLSGASIAMGALGVQQFLAAFYPSRATAPIDQGAEMRAAFMSIEKGLRDLFGGYDACFAER